MKNAIAPSNLLLEEFIKDHGKTEGVFLRIGLFLSLVMVACALVGLELLEEGRFEVNLFGVILAASATAWFLFRLSTQRFAWSSHLGRFVGWGLVASLPSGFLVYEALRGDPAISASSWMPAQLIAVIIAFSVLRLRRFDPAFVGLVAATAYLAGFIYVRTHIPLELADRASFKMGVGLFRAGATLSWGILGSILVVGLRRALRRASARVRSDELLGKYRLGDALGRGGMGEVRRATYCPEGGFVSEVAIKRIHPELVEKPGMVQRFREEAEVGARLRHHNIVATLDFGRMDETYFLAMEYVDGESLRALTRRARKANVSFPDSLVGYLGQEILSGLHFAHEVARCPEGERLRVVHRDLCPNNVLISRSGHVKIADFGVAHALRGAEFFEPTHVVGKVGYLSPEAVRGDALDGRADLFAVGCVLWELLTGEPVFKHKDTLRALEAVLRCDLVSAPGRAWLDSRWIAFFERALSRHPEERFASTREMQEALVRLVPLAATSEEFAAWMGRLEQPFVSLVRAPSSEVTDPRKAADSGFALRVA